MAQQQYNQFGQPQHQGMPQLQTSHLQNQRAFSPPSYQQSPGAMSPTGGIPPPAKRARLSPNPPSPYQSPFSTSPYGTATSPYATSPPQNQYLSLPQSPAAMQPSHSFNQPQPYHHPNSMDYRPAPQGSMPPPKMPYSKAQDNAELEKANARDLDVNNISDVLTGSGIDLRAEEDNLLHFQGSRSYGASFNSQASGSTISPHGSFNQWGQLPNHGAFQGTGPLSQPMSEEQQQAELLRKHEHAARIRNESAQTVLSDPFVLAGVLRHRLGRRANENGVHLNVDGLYDKIPEHSPQNVTRTTAEGPDGESIVGLQASSLLNQNAPLVEMLSLISLAAEERIRTVIEDAFALSQARQNTSHGIVPPSLADIAVANGEARPTTVAPINISKTAWEAAPDSAISPMTVTAQKHPPNAARLPTPPSEAPPTPQPTIQFTNHIINGLKRRVQDDERFEKERLRKRQKRQQGSSATPADTPAIAPMPLPDKISKKERDRLAKAGQTEEVLHRKANETASMALGGKKKYSWMSGGGAASGTSTPRLNTGVGGASAAATPALQEADRKLLGRKRQFGAMIENTDIGANIQIRDLVHVLEHDGKARKALVSILARQKGADKDEKRTQPVTPAR